MEKKVFINFLKLLDCLAIVLLCIAIYNEFINNEGVNNKIVNNEIINSEVHNNELSAVPDFLYEKLDCFEYRNISICEGEQKIPEEKLEVVVTTIDSLHDNVTEIYSMKNNPVYLLYLSELDFYENFNAPQDAYAFKTEWNKNFLIVISTRSLDEVKKRNNGFIQYCDHNMKNQKFFDKNFLSRTIVHEYIHVLQSKYPDFLDTYALAVGWEYNGDDYRPPENLGENFLKVNGPYALTNPYEDQAETYSDPYTCSSNSELLSPERQSFFMEFWIGSREEYCKEFNN